MEVVLDFVDNRCSCQSPTRATPLFEVSDLNFGATVARSVFLRCADCGALFPRDFPAPGSLAEAYRDYCTTPRPRHGRLLRRRLSELGRRTYLDRETPKRAGRVLDFGCGDGSYLRRLCAAGMACEKVGTDVSAPAQEIDDYHWLPMDQLESAALFDWITLGHVLEHLSEPRAALELLSRVLAPGGGLWVATPNADSFLFDIAGPWARDVDFPRHREVFSRRGLTRLFAAAGFEVRFRSPPRSNAIANTLSTLENILGDASLSPRPKALRATAVVSALALRLVRPRERRDRDSPELVLVASKSGK